MLQKIFSEKGYFVSEVKQGRGSKIISIRAIVSAENPEHGFQGISVVTSPGLVIEIVPPHEHMHMLESFNAGLLPINTVGEPGAHGAGITGTHGTGVSTPKAAVVAAATAGFVGLLHIPKEGMFTTGTWSMMFAEGWFSTRSRLVGNTTKVDGAAPKLHCITAPMTTCIAITENSSIAINIHRLKATKSSGNSRSMKRRIKYFSSSMERSMDTFAD